LPSGATAPNGNTVSKAGPDDAPNGPVVGITGRTRLLTNEDVGYSLQIPADSRLQQTSEPGILAAAPDGTSLRVFFERLPAIATVDTCWERLYARVSKDVAAHPGSVDEFRRLAQSGVDRSDQGNVRRVYVTPFPRGESCLVLVAEGPPQSETLARAAPVAAATFKAGEPSAGFSAELDMEGAMQLLDDKKYDVALKRFEAALTANPQNLRAQFGAGLAAYFAGPEYASKAVDYLSRAVAVHVDSEDNSGEGLHPEQYADALMYLGLAYASQKQFNHALSTLAELVDRYPENPTGRYNFACVLALSGDTDGALEQLRTVLPNNPDLAAHAREDDDLRSLHPLPAWKALLGAAPRSSDAAPH
jgi:Tfp pilus assembly protein PilF